MSDAEQIDEFCSALLGGPDGSGDDRLEGVSTYLWTLDHGQPKPIKRTLWSPAHEPGSLASSIRSTVARQPGEIAAVYLSMGLVPNHLVPQKSARNQRANNTDIAGIPAVWADLDIAGPNHKGDQYPPSEAAAKRVLAAIGVKPSIILHTGGGLQAYWLLNEPWLVSDADNPDAERRAMAALSRDVINTLRFHADRLGRAEGHTGWKLDSVFDLARVMRAPGSLNTKTDPARTVRILHIDPACRYEPDEIREGLAGAEELKEFLESSTAGGVSITGGAGMPGVDLHKAWETVRGAAGHTPEWMTFLLENGKDDLVDTWEGNRPDLKGDQSAIDAALVRLLIQAGRSAQQQAEAIMARRLRGDHQVEKVDPAQRQDYVLRTIVNIQASAARALHEREVRTSITASAIASAASSRLTSTATAAAPEPVAVPDQRRALRSVPEPAPTPAVKPEPEHKPAQRREQEDAPPPDEDEFGNFVTDLVAPDLEPDVDPEPEPEKIEAAREQVRAESPKTANTPTVSMSSDRPREGFTEHGAEHVQLMDMLANLLLPDPYRTRGVKVWELQARDRGPDATGRMVLRFPVDFDWPGNARPETYRPGLPFYCAWFKRGAFETPLGYQRSVIYDAKIPAVPVGSNKEDWNQLITALVPYWKPDSSGSSLTTQVVQWLLEYLVGRPATGIENEALVHSRPYLRDHAEWGARGAPVVFAHTRSFLDYVGTQPGGATGRAARGLLAHLAVNEERIRLTDEAGIVHRAHWLRIEADQFDHDEWAQVLTAAREAADGRERRNLKLMKGGA